MRKKLSFACLFIFMALTCVVSHGADSQQDGAPMQIIIPANTPVNIELDQYISSQENRVGDTVMFHVKAPVLVNNVEVISTGA